MYDSETGSRTLDGIENLLARVWSAHRHVPSVVRMQVGIAIGEIAGNIVEHAAADCPVRIRMEVRVGLAEVRVDFTDDGAPTGVDLDRVVLPDEMAETGRGLVLARAVLRQLSYCRNGLNHWTLVSKPF